MTDIGVVAFDDGMLIHVEFMDLSDISCPKRIETNIE